MDRSTPGRTVRSLWVCAALTPSPAPPPRPQNVRQISWLKKVDDPDPLTPVCHQCGHAQSQTYTEEMQTKQGTVFAVLLPFAITTSHSPCVPFQHLYWRNAYSAQSGTLVNFFLPSGGRCHSQLHRRSQLKWDQRAVGALLFNSRIFLAAQTVVTIQTPPPRFAVLMADNQPQDDILTWWFISASGNT